MPYTCQHCHRARDDRYLTICPAREPEVRYGGGLICTR